jgi:hypothetical protein
MNHLMTEQFYVQLASFSDFTYFADPQYYRPLPDDWTVVITDVVNSTQAITAGKYKQVNSIGVASIVAVMNGVQPLQIPFVFGGDGATICLPGSVVGRSLPYLAAARTMARDYFDLDLRLGLVPMTEIRHAGHEIFVGKYSPHPHYRQAMLLGAGLAFAEEQVKDPDSHNPYLLADDLPLPPGDATAVFAGFECRWNEIPSPHEEDVALLVQTVQDDPVQTAQIYAEILQEIKKIYGEDAAHHPLRENNMQLSGSPQVLGIEAAIRTAFQSPWQRAKYWLRLQVTRFVGTYLMGAGVQTGTTDWGVYKQDLIANTDYRKFDQVLRMVISGTARQRARLRAVLETYRRNGDIVFGLHASPAALITCVVTSHHKNHFHFLDGADGGYALAARELKKQLAETV